MCRWIFLASVIHLHHPLVFLRQLILRKPASFLWIQLSAICQNISDRSGLGGKTRRDTSKYRQSQPRSKCSSEYISLVQHIWKGQLHQRWTYSKWSDDDMRSPKHSLIRCDLISEMGSERYLKNSSVDSRFIACCHIFIIGLSFGSNFDKKIIQCFSNAPI